MNVSEHLKADRILLDLNPSDKNALIQSLVDELCKRSKLTEKGFKNEDIIAAVLEREEQFPTAMGKGVAMPHARLEGLPELTILLARWGNPIQWNEDEVAKAAFLVLIPDDKPQIALQMYSLIATTFNDEEKEKAFFAAKDEAELIQILTV